MHSVVVLTNGCFDPLHYGHLLHLKAAKEMGDVLVVSITHDNFVNKGPHRPVFTHDQRRSLVKELNCVDRTIIVENAMEALRRIRPTIFVKGADYRGKIEPEHEHYCIKHGIKICFTDEPQYSSTDLLRYYETRSRLAV